MNDWFLYILHCFPVVRSNLLLSHSPNREYYKLMSFTERIPLNFSESFYTFACTLCMTSLSGAWCFTHYLVCISVISETCRDRFWANLKLWYKYVLHKQLWIYGTVVTYIMKTAYIRNVQHNYLYNTITCNVIGIPQEVYGRLSNHWNTNLISKVIVNSRDIWI